HDLRRALVPGEHSVRPRVIPPLPRRLSVILILGSVLETVSAAPRPASAAKTPRNNPTIVLDSPEGERTIPAVDLRFVFYERIYYRRRAPRSEDANGERRDVADRLRDGRCPGLEDRSEVNVSNVRQID